MVGGARRLEARQLGLKRVLVTCDDTNIASARTIERNGGQLEDTRDTELGHTRRYWIDLYPVGSEGGSEAEGYLEV